MTTIRKNITQPADWWAAFERQAAAEDMKLSAWVGECCRAYLSKAEAEQLSERPAIGPPKQSKGD